MYVCPRRSSVIIRSAGCACVQLIARLLKTMRIYIYIYMSFSCISVSWRASCSSSSPLGALVGGAGNQRVYNRGMVLYTVQING